MRQEITIQKAFRVCASICFFLLGSCYPKFGGDAEIEDHPKYLEQISYLNVKITDNFWGPKIKMNGEKGIPSVFEAGKTSLENFGIAAKIIEGEHNQRMASDSDVYKIIQGVAYSLHHSSDKELEEFTDNLIDWIVAAQEDDGYLFT
jgi:uncharacterized protein